MKKKGIFFVLLVFLIFFISFISALDNESTVDEKAYACLEDKVTDKCSDLSTEEKIFSLLTIDRCKTELLEDESSSSCWPDSSCKVKTTAQAILALSHVNANTAEAEAWLLEKTMDFTDVNWFVQIDSTNKTSCTAKYSSKTYKFKLNEDKSISTNAGSCLKVYDNYWFKVSSGCYDEDFEISCNNSFTVSLLYKKDDSSVVYVSQDAVSSSAEGTVTETVASSCFKDKSSCSYEGSLWAAMVLKYRGYDVSAYIPYLISMADENEKYLPESFLYYLTDDFGTDLLALQKESKWWSVSGDKFYDTAVALMPYQNEEITEKDNAIDWLTEVQGTDGCWQGNIRNTAILLYSLWPKESSLTNATSSADCENSGYSCMSSAACTSAGGSLLSNYGGCYGTINLCCSKSKELDSCSVQNGELCTSGQDCVGGSIVSSSDTNSLQSCCVNGKCGTVEVAETSECESYGGICRTSCYSDEQFSSYDCTSGSCCVEATSSESGSNIWLIIVLIILIILVLVGIIFRKKLRELFLKLKTKFGKGGKPKPAVGPGPRFPPTSSQRVYPGAVPRRIIPPAQRPSVPRPSPQKKSEVDDVLNKLKEMGK